MAMDFIHIVMIYLISLLLFCAWFSIRLPLLDQHMAYETLLKMLIDFSMNVMEGENG